MLRGCISSGEITCDSCNLNIPYPERYLAKDEENPDGEGKSRIIRYCVKCCMERGLAHYKFEKGERVLTFFEE